MGCLHMHVISQDFDSPCLKTKQHWNSFTTKYFVGSETVFKEIQNYGLFHRDAAASKALLKSDLRCNQCEVTPSTMPALKQHLHVAHQI
jgi:aprataxin